MDGTRRLRRTWIQVVLFAGLGVVSGVGVVIVVLPKVITHCGGTRQAKAAADVYGIAESLHGFWVEHGGYPTTEQGLVALTRTALNADREFPWYALDKVSLDPWGHPYSYRSDGRTFVLKCYGADGKDGGHGGDADIDSDSLLGR